MEYQFKSPSVFWGEEKVRSSKVAPVPSPKDCPGLSFNFQECTMSGDQEVLLVEQEINDLFVVMKILADIFAGKATS